MVERAEEIYQALLDAGISENDLITQIKEKESEFQGFMTKQAILYLIAKEYGVDVNSSENVEILDHIREEVIDYNDFAIKISDITENMRNIVVSGRITQIYGKRDFLKKDGTPGKVRSFQICDQSECIKIVLWDDQSKIMDNEFFQKGEIIQVVAGYSKCGIDNKLELHLSRNGKLILAPEGVILSKSVKNENSNKSINKNINKTSSYKIKDLYQREGFIKFVKGNVTIDTFKELTLKNGEKSFLLKLNLSDETSSINVIIWGMTAIELVKIINDGDSVKISNVIIKENSYSNEKEIQFTKSSRLTPI